jgi:hypothetical protein
MEVGFWEQLRKIFERNVESFFDKKYRKIL